MKKIFFISIFILSHFLSPAQSYKTALGLRIGTEFGFTLQQKILKRTTIEGILQSSFKRKEFQLTVMAEKHYPVLSKRINIYTGAGLHKAWRYDGDNSSVNPLGISAVLGAEITVGRFNISYDFKPAINFKGRPIFDSQTGISLRYILFQDRWVDRAKKKIKKFRKK